MREPAFWYRPPSLISRLLSPFGAMYGAVSARRMARAGVSAGVPVFCVGNYHAGGAGKTPTTLALVKILRSMGEQPFVVSRGYGGTVEGPVRVDQTSHSAADVGDEPLMMAASVPVIVSRDRVAGAALARAQGASVVLLDDGFQNPALAKDASLIVIDASRGVGNGCVFPAGPLRAPLAPQVARTDALIMIGDGQAADGIAVAVTERHA
ncbi:MAG: tetraacyldisaccharide 4'-kinase, partial [Afipia sp.]|nr:tetraacyldisaccharide 4'-kinase [Afipia sp.]